MKRKITYRLVKYVPAPEERLVDTTLWAVVEDVRVVPLAVCTSTILAKAERRRLAAADTRLEPESVLVKRSEK